MTAVASRRAPVLPRRRRRQLVAFATAVVLAWRKVLAAPDGRGGITGLFVATVAVALGLALLGDWLSRHEQGR